MKDFESAYAVAHIKTLENRMLTRADIDAMISAKDAREVRKALAERGFGEGSTAEILKGELSRAWSAAYEVCPDDAPIDLLLYENDFHNLKTALKAHVASVSCENMLLSPSVIPAEELLAAVKGGDFSALPDFIRDVAAEAYTLLTSTMDGQLCEIFIDKAYFEKANARARQTGDEFLIGYFELLQTLADLKTAWRCALSQKSRSFRENALGTPHEELTAGTAQIAEYIRRLFPDAVTSSIGAFERWCDNRRLAYVRTAKAKFFGFAPIAAFLIGKSFEIQALRIILACKENGLGDTVIRERLRDLYV